MYARITTLVVWAMLAGSMVFWLLKLSVNPLPAPAHVVAALDNASSRVDLSRLLGTVPAGEAPEVAAAAESRFHLVGVVAPKRGGESSEGVASISVDGKPARPYRVGATVDADLRLLSLTSSSAALGSKDKPEASNLVLQLAPPGAAVNRPIVTGGVADNPTGQQGGAPSALALANRMSVVKMTMGQNPAPETADKLEADAPAEAQRGSVSSGDLTR